METGRVLAVGCLDSSASVGLDADRKAVTAQEILVTTVSTGKVIRDRESIMKIIETTPSVFQNQINECIHNTNVKVLKIGALFSVESVDIVSSILQRSSQILSVIDVEPIFKTGPAPKPEIVTALRKNILPSITILSATIPEVKALLDEAGIKADYPKNMEDVVEMAKTLRSLGPRFVLIKREIFEEFGKSTTLHFVLSGDGEPLIANSRFENPKSVTGASYSIPPVIAANLTKGQDVPQAVSAAFKSVEEAIKGGALF